MNMIKFAIIGIIIVAVAGAAFYVYRMVGPGAPAANPAPAGSKLYDFTMKDINGKDVKLESFKGKVLLVVNTASKCGYTPQYKGLQETYLKYKDQGFVVLGFPANNFMGQEPGSNDEIKEFCELRYKVTFPMFAKISVKGADQDPLYNFLTTQTDFKGDISWNFNKFLVDKEGKVIARFGSGDEPDGQKVVSAIESALK